MEMCARHYEELGVCWHMERQRTASWYFSSFSNRFGEKGNGAKALRELCEYADAVGISIELFAQHRSGQREKLVQYYESFGFFDNGDRLGQCTCMTREPISASERRVA
jgi:hypothetical protein